MYTGFLIGCFFVFPVVSIVIEHAVRRRRGEDPDLLGLVLRWFTFWIAGVRLLIAGLTQAFRPEFTAESIFNTTDPTVLPFISELGYSNIAIGLIGVLSLRLRSWTAPAALAGAVFLGLAGIRHLVDGGAFTTDRAFAAGTDIFALVILLGALLAAGLRSRRE
ncbi:hypothetical protein C6V83_14590 [Gordonia iterans]|uniref:DoxX family protein n=1 Tax=Gordonia iterans TaxID=1004901 RepID=A0A2S0KHW7_9ACTN|nr:DUF6790 family protein [Gordonia iterans]AVM01287.1 hypothetical protein C6V83_14590 [Gordonia iterans]